MIFFGALYGAKIAKRNVTSKIFTNVTKKLK